MNTLETTAGRAYAGHPDYDVLRGRKVGEFTVERKDKRRNCTIWTTYEVIDLGRSEPVTPNPDAALVDEQLPGEGNSKAVIAAVEAMRQQKTERDAKMLADIAAHLQASGPDHVKSISEAIERNRGAVLRTLREHKDMFVKMPMKVRVHHRWGLVGIHDTQNTEAA